MKRVETSISIDRPASKVFSAFTDADLLKGWWGVDRCLVEKKQGGLYSLAWDVSKNGFRYISTGVITVYSPDRELLIDHFVYFNPEKSILGPTYLNIKINKTSKGVDLDLIQGGYREGSDWEWFYEAVQQAWPTALETLKKYLEAN